VSEDCVILDLPEGLRPNLLGLIVQIYDSDSWFRSNAVNERSRDRIGGTHRRRQ
jgi:hypothetical protein